MAAALKLEHIDTMARCVSGGVPRSNWTSGMNNSYQFIQAPGYVGLYTEYNHQLRIIPLDGRPHVGPGVRLYNGDSVEHWEGNTLIVETTNVETPPATRLGSLDFQGTPFTDALTIVERFTVVDADTITFEVRLTDPKAYTRPVTIAGAFVRAPQDFIVFEHACHEGNDFNMDIMAFRIPRRNANSFPKP